MTSAYESCMKEMEEMQRKITELQSQLSRYQGGVEVEGKIDWKGNIQISRKCQDLDNFGVGQLVRCVVAPLRESA